MATPAWMAALKIIKILKIEASEPGGRRHIE
jgi:hypothetical protein